MGAVVAVAGFAARALLGLAADPQGLAFSAASLVELGRAVRAQRRVPLDLVQGVVFVLGFHATYGERHDVRDVDREARHDDAPDRGVQRLRRSLSRWAASATGPMGLPAPLARSAMNSSEMVARQIRTE